VAKRGIYTWPRGMSWLWLDYLRLIRQAVCADRLSKQEVLLRALAYIISYLSSSSYYYMNNTTLLTYSYTYLGSLLIVIAYLYLIILFSWISWLFFNIITYISFRILYNLLVFLHIIIFILFYILDSCYKRS
jgi:hypothetical protein